MKLNQLYLLTPQFEQISPNHLPGFGLVDKDLATILKAFLHLSISFGSLGFKFVDKMLIDWVERVVLPFFV